MNEEINILEKLLIAEAPKQCASAEKHLKDIERDANRLCKILQSLGAKIADFAADENLPNSIKCRVWENITQHTGISKTIAKFLRDKHALSTEINRYLPQNEKITAQEFFELDCMLGFLSRRDIPKANLHPEEKARLLLLARKHNKSIPHLMAKIKKGR